MVSSKAHKIALRGRASQLFQHGDSLSCVARELGIGKSTAGDWLKQWHQNKDSFESRPERKRQVSARKYSPRDLQEIRAFAESHPRTSIRSIAQVLPRLGIHTSKSTVWRLVARQGLRSFRTVLKPKLTRAQKRKRMNFATDKKEFPFDTVAATDEFELSTNGKSTWFRAYTHAQVPDEPSQKFAPKLRFWAAITHTRVLPIRFYEGKLNAPKYQKILEDALPDIAAAFEGHEWWLLHDNASWHTAYSSQEYLQESPYTAHWFLPGEYPPNSPDCNVIENLMGRISVLVHQCQPQNREQLRSYLLAEWANVTPAMLTGLFDSYPERLTAIRQKKGGRTRY